MNKKWMKLIALALIALMSVTLLASCKSGKTYADKPGEDTIVSVVVDGASDEIEVPYTGDPIPGPVYQTTDLQYYQGGDTGNSGNSGDSGDSGNSGNSGDTGNSGDSSNGGDSDDSGDNGDSGEKDYSDLVADDTGTKIRLMAQNIRTGGSLTGTGDGENNMIGLRRYRFQALVQEYNPDVICTQEVTPLWIEQFQSLLPEYDLVYKMRSEKSKEATPVHWKKDKYEAVDVQHYWLSKTPNVESSCYGEAETNSIPGRITTQVKLKDKATGAEFTVISTHWGLGGGATVRGCGNQLAETVAKLPKGSYAFVLGDYNDRYQSTEYFSYCDGIRVVDLRDVCAEMADVGIGEMGELGGGSFNGFNEDNKTSSGSNWIDHCLAKPNNKMAVEFFGYLYDRPSVPSQNVSEGYVSDHFALLVDVRINTSRSYVDFYGNAG